MQNINYIHEISTNKKKSDFKKNKKNQKEYLISFEVRDRKFQSSKDGMVDDKAKKIKVKF